MHKTVRISKEVYDLAKAFAEAAGGLPLSRVAEAAIRAYVAAKGRKARRRAG
jgi:hypothetical protein